MITVIVCTGLLWPAGSASLDADAPRVEVVDHPPLEGANPVYPGNRPPLGPDPLIKLPVGAVRARGWLLGQLELLSGGMIGHLPEVSRWARSEGNAWMSKEGRGDHPWEELPYWLKGFGDLGYLLEDERITAEARKWIEAILASQEDDGWFGPRANKSNHDVWPNMIALNVLQSYHENTGDARVFPFMSRYFRWQLEQPREHILPGSWQKIRGGDNLLSIYWLYNRTGEAWLLDLARVIHERTADWTAGIASWHGVNICQSFREPAQFYLQSHDPAHLEATRRNYRRVMDLYGQVPGGMFGADENCRPGFRGPRQAAETCSMVEFMLSDEILLGITGDPVFADRCEEIAFNSLPAAFTPDYRALHYLTAPNMVQLDRDSKSPGLQNGGCMLAYSAAERYRCCQHNASHGWPYFTEHLVMATRDRGLAAVLYAPCEVRARVAGDVDVRLVEDTGYPFRDDVRVTVRTANPTEFPLYLRVPGWCDAPGLTLNGERLDAPQGVRGYLRVTRTWRDGDRLRLDLPAEIRLRRWATNGNSVSVERGPLTFSLEIGERWERFGGSDRWPEFEVFPTTPWNYALTLNEESPADSFEVLRDIDPIPDQPFTPGSAPLRLKARGCRVSAWGMEGGLVGRLQESPVIAAGPEEVIRLIPMGCARLRISAFPVRGTGPTAVEWVEPKPPPVSASHVHDDVRAPVDGVVPSHSNDHSIPRFTWWDRLGSREWIAWEFEKIRRVSSADVYWFDDTGVGRCRVPARWRLLWKDGERWREVTGASSYEVDPDRFNRVTFDPVETGALRIEVQLRDEYSGGILEWRVD